MTVIINSSYYWKEVRCDFKECSFSPKKSSESSVQKSKDLNFIFESFSDDSEDFLGDKEHSLKSQRISFQ